MVTDDKKWLFPAQMARFRMLEGLRPALRAPVVHRLDDRKVGLLV
ncbi:hypothetical protein [Streptomyces sp. NHF165]|nr:hypothetical protein [Streptomyces sp. NHF165]